MLARVLQRTIIIWIRAIIQIGALIRILISNVLLFFVFHFKFILKRSNFKEQILREGSKKAKIKNKKRFGQKVSARRKTLHHSCIGMREVSIMNKVKKAYEPAL